MTSGLTVSGYAGQIIAADADGPETGLPVILAHGGGQTRRAWKKISTLLAGHGFRAFAIDLRGHGDSDWASDGAYEFADFLIQTRAASGAR